ncbi:protein of unknown function [Methylococcus capsulatus]|uniref:Uncharacterized protein n=1 Tax=Methylococcus capsulatus TaxID=414 RepID=A0AA35UKK0_METCP|nr:protein of unknown function [Methylococcus capsulatus]
MRRTNNHWRFLRLVLSESEGIGMFMESLIRLSYCWGGRGGYLRQFATEDGTGRQAACRVRARVRILGRTKAFGLPSRYGT